MKMRYNPALDGLRAIAITFVILFHSDREIFPGGWIGVDIFFVLSGYLITTILAFELKKTGSISWRNFYARRALRLTPALLVMAAFLILVSTFTHDNELRQSVMIGAVYLENWNKIFGFVADGPTNLMGHTWSLATEEQFYLLWPITLFAIFKRHPALWLGAAIAAMMIARVWLWCAGALDHLIFGLDARPVGLLVGCLLALTPLARLPRLSAAVAIGAMAVLFAIGLLVGADLHWRLILSPLIASVATAAIIVAASPGSATARLLAWGPAVYVGRISYGLYLYSFPIFLLGERWKVHAPFHLYGVGLIALIIIVAAASYEFVERPFLRLKDRFQDRTAIGIIAGSGLAVRS
jgi:peptidoglycan/LPS O-acetylase OafA/YrhL